jgi:hypothetical protein
MAAPPTPGLPPLSSTSCHLPCPQNTNTACTFTAPMFQSSPRHANYWCLLFFLASELILGFARTSLLLTSTGLGPTIFPLHHFSTSSTVASLLMPTLAFSPRPECIPSLCYDRLWRSSSIPFPVPTKYLLPRSCAQCQKHFTR